MPNPSIWGPLLALVLVFGIVGPAFAGASLLLTKHPRTRYFWIFTALCALAGGWWLSTLVAPERVFGELFHQASVEGVHDLDYEIDRRADRGVLVMRFRTTPEILRRLIGVRALQAEPLVSAVGIVPEDFDLAGWWPPSWATGAEAYHGLGIGSRYRRLEEWLLHDPETGDVRYVMVGRARP